MALPWSALVKAIPWSDVITKAPELAQGARKLWQKASGRTDSAATATATTGAPLSADERIASLEARVADMLVRQQDGAELVAALAAQNAELVSTAEALRGQLRRLWLAVGGATLLAAAGLMLALLSH